MLYAIASSLLITESLRQPNLHGSPTDLPPVENSYYGNDESLPSIIAWHVVGHLEVSRTHAQESVVRSPPEKPNASIRFLPGCKVMFSHRATFTSSGFALPTDWPFTLNSTSSQFENTSTP